jgi:predicted transcriptional regulator
MSLTRNDNWTNQETKTATLGSAFSSEVRVRILQLLISEPGLTATDISKRLRRSKSTINSHMSFLKDADLIREDYVFHQLELSLKKQKQKLVESFFKSCA